MANLTIGRLGNCEFNLEEGAFTDLERETRYRVDVPSPIEGLGKPDFLGPESDQITLRGVVFPGFAGKRMSVQRLRDLAGTGESHLLVDGEGTLYGYWKITEVNERQSTFLAGGLARRISWDVRLVADPDATVVPR